jgi:hypothetical protein
MVTNLKFLFQSKYIFLYFAINLIELLNLMRTNENFFQLVNRYFENYLIINDIPISKHFENKHYLQYQSIMNRKIVSIDL